MAMPGEVVGLGAREVKRPFVVEIKPRHSEVADGRFRLLDEFERPAVVVEADDTETLRPIHRKGEDRAPLGASRGFAKELMLSPRTRVKGRPRIRWAQTGIA